MSIYLFLIEFFSIADFSFGEYVSDKNRFKKWWRKNIVDCDPDEK